MRLQRLWKNPLNSLLEIIFISKFLRVTAAAFA